MKKKKLKISIITVSLNSEHKIERSIKSVINQNYIKNKIEHIIIDGKSSDNTVNIIKKYNKTIKHWQSSKDKGIYYAMNKGIKLCSGEIIGILNSDDYYYPNTFNIVNNYFLKYKIDFLFGSVEHKKLYHGFYPKKIWYKFNIYPSHSVGFFINRKVQQKIGLYDTKFKFSSDRDLLYRLINSKFSGMATNKNEIFGKFAVDGLSSRLPYYTRLIEEIRIRINNKQSKIYLFFLFFTVVIHKAIMFFIIKK